MIVRHLRLSLATASLCALIASAARAQEPAATTTAQQEPTATLSANSPADRAMKILTDDNMPIEERRVEILKIVNDNPNDAESWAAYGEALEKLGERDKALMAFQKATELNPKLYSPWQWLGILYKRGNPAPDYAKAEEAFRRAITEGAPRPSTLNELAVTLALQGKSKDAVAAWKQAIEADPEWGVLYNNLFKVATNLRDEKLCMEYFDRALHAKRFEESAVMQLGEYFIATGKNSRAVEIYNKATEAHPDNARIRYYYASALAADGKKNDARAEFNNAITIAKKSNEVSDVVQSAEWALFKLDNAKAEKDFQAARKLVFQPEVDWAKMKPDLEKAVKQLNPLIEKYPDFWNGYFVRGVAYRRLNEVALAEKDLQKVLSLHPDEPNATMELALMKRDQYDFAAAADFAEKAIALAPRDPMFAINGGLIMIEAGRCDRAWELYRISAKMVGEPNAAILRDQLEARCKQ
ncbi:tetratricopeptide repeat protein [Candidatus Sumerlaeota bacterium]|nr:tetratricopeptide repeat protein [Candidatus Sumerlaeota bacterium]